MSDDWEQYRSRFASERPETFDAIVDVWNNVPGARANFSGWAVFSQFALAEEARVKQDATRVRLAESIMERGGYTVGPPTSRGARRWVRTR